MYSVLDTAVGKVAKQKGAPVGDTSCTSGQVVSRISDRGHAHEWHVDLSKSFEYIAFNVVSRFHHAIVLLLSTFALPRFKSVGAIRDAVGGDSVE